MLNLSLADQSARPARRFYTYESDSQESDIEILTSHLYTGNDAVDPGLQLTNQATNGNSSDNTRKAIPYPSDPTTGEHEVRHAPNVLIMFCIRGSGTDNDCTVRAPVGVGLIKVLL